MAVAIASAAGGIIAGGIIAPGAGAAGIAAEGLADDAPPGATAFGSVVDASPLSESSSAQPRASIITPNEIHALDHFISTTSSDETTRARETGEPAS